MMLTVDGRLDFLGCSWGGTGKLTSAHLLSNHDSKRCEGGTTNSRDGEELGETREVVAVSNDLVLDFELCVDVVHVTGSLKGVVSKLDEGSVGLWVSVLLWCVH
jgi:hypothetical protein